MTIGNKFPDREFYWTIDQGFYSRLGIYNYKSVWSADKFYRKLMLLRKSESSLEQKLVSLNDIFQASRNPVRKRKIYKEKIVIQNSAPKCYHELHLRSGKYLEILILAAPFLLLTKIIL